MMYSTVVFDMGNVVLFFDHGIICRKVADLYKLDEQFVFGKIFEEGIEKKFDEGKLTPELFTQECASALDIPLELDKFRDIWSEIFTENRPVVEMIEQLKTKSRILLLSNTNIWHVEYVKSKYTVLKHFDELIFSFQVGCVKPDRRMFERIIAFSGDAGSTIYIDDIESHVEAASKFGFRGIRYTAARALRVELVGLGLL